MFRPGFRPGRELNQAQGILQDQIEQIASSLLKDGDVITPGEFYMTNPAPYIRVSSLTNGSRPEEYVGYNLKGVQSGVMARVVHAEEATEDDDVTFYVIYEDSGTTSEFETFLEQETLESALRTTLQRWVLLELVSLSALLLLVMVSHSN